MNASAPWIAKPPICIRHSRQSSFRSRQRGFTEMTQLTQLTAKINKITKRCIASIYILSHFKVGKHVCYDFCCCSCSSLRFFWLDGLSCHVMCHAGPCVSWCFLNHWRRLLGSMDSEQMITTSLLATHIWRRSIFGRVGTSASRCSQRSDRNGSTNCQNAVGLCLSWNSWNLSLNVFILYVRRTPPLQMSLMILDV